MAREEKDLDAIFKACPTDLPSDLSVRINEESIKRAYLFIKHTSRKQRELDDSGLFEYEIPAGTWYHCTRCGTTDYIEEKKCRYKHKEHIECPCCDCSVQVHDMKYGRKSAIINNNYAILKVLNENEAYIRCFFADFDYSGEVEAPTFTLQESERYYLSPDFSVRWKWNITSSIVFGGNYDRYVYGTYKTIKKFDDPFHITAPYISRYEGYISDFSDIKKCFLRYSAVGIYDKIDGGSVDTKYGSMYQEGVHIIRYLQSYCKYPFLEKLLKCGFKKAVFDFIENGGKKTRELDFRADSFAAFFKHKLCREEIKVAKELTAEQISRYIKCRDKMLREHPEKPPKKIKTLARAVCEVNNDRLEQLMTLPVDFTRVVEYLAKTDNMSHIREYKDYISECVQIGYDISKRIVAFPPNLQTAHRAASKILADRVAEEKARKYKKLFAQRAQQLQPFVFSGDVRYIIRVPVSPEELITEGDVQEICIANYIEDHAEGRANILFLRKCSAYDTPFYAIEMGNDGKIWQCRGFANNMRGNPMPDDVREFKEAFEQFARRTAEKLNKKEGKKNERIA